MDMSFADQALSANTWSRTYKTLEKKVFTVPVRSRQARGALKLESMASRSTSSLLRGEYLASWSEARKANF